MDDLDDRAQKGLESLRRSVAEDLERKRRLGQYAVFWRDGRVVYDGPDAPKEQPDSDFDNDPDAVSPPRDSSA